jgi:CRISPR-associated protein Cmr6
MSKQDAEITVGELLGTLTSPNDNGSRRGCVRIQMIPGNVFGKKSRNQPDFFVWQGSLKINAPTEILNKILIPIIRFAVMVGGVGRGWRRPLHIYTMPNGRDASRGSLLYLTHQVKQKDSQQMVSKPFGLATNPQDWQTLYQNWAAAVQSQWPARFLGANQNPQAEVFSPTTCAVYLVPDPLDEPIDKHNEKWFIQAPLQTRGKGMALIYQPNYKHQSDVGGAAARGNAHCSWVSIKRVKVSKQGCQEVVCLFMGGEQPNTNHLRSHFLRDLANIPGAVHLFGVQP